MKYLYFQQNLFAKHKMRLICTPATHKVNYGFEAIFCPDFIRIMYFTMAFIARIGLL